MFAVKLLALCFLVGVVHSTEAPKNEAPKNKTDSPSYKDIAEIPVDYVPGMRSAAAIASTPEKDKIQQYKDKKFPDSFTPTPSYQSYPAPPYQGDNKPPPRPFPGPNSFPPPNSFPGPDPYKNVPYPSSPFSGGRPEQSYQPVNRYPGPQGPAYPLYPGLQQSASGNQYPPPPFYQPFRPQQSEERETYYEEGEYHPEAFEEKYSGSSYPAIPGYPSYPPHCPTKCNVDLYNKCTCLSPAAYTADGRGNCNVGASKMDLRVWCYVDPKEGNPTDLCPDALPSKNKHGYFWSRIACITN